MTESLDESRKFHRGFIFGGSVLFMDLVFWVRFCLVIIFLGITKNVWAEPPCHIHLRVHSLGVNSTYL